VLKSITGHKPPPPFELLPLEDSPVTVPLAVSALLKNVCSRKKKNAATAKKIPPIQVNLLIDNMALSY
jgi:hypothetical protein